jgi:hypothetical protein
VLLLYNFHISFYILLISNSGRLSLTFLLCDAIATFAHMDLADYFVAVELAPFEQGHKSCSSGNNVGALPQQRSKKKIVFASMLGI